MPIKFVSHTADIKVRIISNSLCNLFRLGVSSIYKYLNPKIDRKSKEKLKKKIVITGKELTTVFIDFLSEILSITYINRAKFKVVSFKILNLKDLIKVVAEVDGSKFSDLKRDIKAVTYHQAKILKRKRKYLAEFIFDI